MRTITVEVTAEEYENLVALRAADDESLNYTVERYLGRVLSSGARIRSGALQLDIVSWKSERTPSAQGRASHRDRDRAGWWNGRA